VVEAFREYPFCDEDRPVMERESVMDPVVDELSVSVRVNENDLVDTGDRRSGVVRVWELAAEVEMDGRTCARELSE
jgi:hypothetical protein